MARQHFKTTGLCSHTTPNGQSILGEVGKLERKFRKGTITDDELWAYCLMIHTSKKPSITVSGKVEIDVPVSKEKFKTITVWGKELQVTVEEYQKHYATLK